MTPFMKYIMHGLASGQVPPSPQVMKTLKKLQCHREISSSKSEPVPAPAKSRPREETSSDADQRVRTH